MSELTLIVMDAEVNFVGTAESGRKSWWKGLDKRVWGKWVSRSDVKTG